MRIQGIDQLPEVGEETKKAIRKAFDWGAWFFSSPDEMEGEAELTDRERYFCRSQFNRGGKWALVVRIHCSFHFHVFVPRTDGDYSSDGEFHYRPGGPMGIH